MADRRCSACPRGLRTSSGPYQTLTGTPMADRSKPHGWVIAMQSSIHPSTPSVYAARIRSWYPSSVRRARSPRMPASGSWYSGATWTPPAATAATASAARRRTRGRYACSPAAASVNSSTLPADIPANQSRPGAPKGAGPTTLAQQVTRRGSIAAQASACGAPPEPPQTANLPHPMLFLRGQQPQPVGHHQPFHLARPAPGARQSSLRTPQNRHPELGPYHGGRHGVTGLGGSPPRQPRTLAGSGPGTRCRTMPKWSRYAVSTASSVGSCCSERDCPAVTIKVRPLIEILPSSVSREQIGAAVKWESAEVWCHQQVGTKSASDRARGSIRYCGLPSASTSTSPSPASASRNWPAGSSCPCLLS